MGGINPYFTTSHSTPMSQFVKEEIPIDLIMSNLRERQKYQDAERKKLDALRLFDQDHAYQKDKSIVQGKKSEISNFVERMYNTDMSQGSGARNVSRFIANLSGDAELKGVAKRTAERNEYNKIRSQILAKGQLFKQQDLDMNNRMAAYESGEYVPENDTLGLSATTALNRKAKWESGFNNLKANITSKYGVSAATGLMSKIKSGGVYSSKIDEIVKATVDDMINSSEGEQERQIFEHKKRTGEVHGNTKFETYMKEKLTNVGKEFTYSINDETIDYNYIKMQQAAQEAQSPAAVSEEGPTVGGDNVLDIINSADEGGNSASQNAYSNNVKYEYLTSFEAGKEGQSYAQASDEAANNVYSGVPEMLDELSNIRLENHLGLTHIGTPRQNLYRDPESFNSKAFRVIANKYAEYAGPQQRREVGELWGSTSVSADGVSLKGMPSSVKIPLEEFGITAEEAEAWNPWGEGDEKQDAIEDAAADFRRTTLGKKLHDASEKYTNAFEKYTDGNEVSIGKDWIIKDPKIRGEAEEVVTAGLIGNYEMVNAESNVKMDELETLQNDTKTKATFAINTNLPFPAMRITGTTKKNNLGGQGRQVTALVRPKGNWRNNGPFVNLLNNTFPDPAKRKAVTAKWDFANFEPPINQETNLREVLKAAGEHGYVHKVKDDVEITHTKNPLLYGGQSSFKLSKDGDDVTIAEIKDQLEKDGQILDLRTVLPYALSHSMSGTTLIMDLVNKWVGIQQGSGLKLSQLEQSFIHQALSTPYPFPSKGTTIQYAIKYLN